MAYKDIVENAPIRDYVAVTMYNAINELRPQQLNLYHLQRTYDLVNNCSKRFGIDICLKCGTRYFDKADYCNNKLCPICARLRALKQLAFLLPEYEGFLRAGKKICFMTLTIKDTPNLKQGLDLLEKAWEYMTRDDAFSRYHFKKMFAGGIRAVEIKKGKYSNLWHPHMHILVIKNHYSKDFDKLRGLWEIACQHVMKTKEKIGSVDIRGVKNRSNITTSEINDQVSLMHAVVECVKYITKFNFKNYTAYDLLELCNNVHNRRTLNTFGILYGLRSKLELQNGDDLVELREIVCTHCGGRDFDYEVIFDNKLPEDIEEFPHSVNSKLNRKLKKVSQVVKMCLSKEYKL